MGYHRAGFEVVGVDIRPQPRYPFAFVQADALDYPLVGFDAIHASPPCQRFSDLARRNKNADEWPDLIAPMRARLALAGIPWVIENVEGAPLINPIMLCGVQFPPLRVIRHRLFETSFGAWPSPHRHRPHPLVFTHDKRKSHFGVLREDDSFVQVTGGGNCRVRTARRAMGIDWMTKDELNEAIPPAYTEYIGRQLLQLLAKS